MYQDFYHLRAEPFRLTPDPRYRYEHPSYVKARSYMRYAMDRGEGFVVITGRPGTGKTTLIEEFLSGQSEKGLVTARLVSTQMGTDDLIRMVAHGFHVETGDADRVSVLQRLSRFLMTNAEAGRRAALVIDEAQDLTRETLEALRMLTNLQHGPRSVLQIFLVGQEQLRRVVYGPGMEQLRQRILVATRLETLDAEQTRIYIQHRLQCAGGGDDPRFSERAVALIHAASEGLPREINKFCGRLLLHGSIEEKHALTAADVLEVLDELRHEQLVPLAEDAAASFGLDLSDTVEPPSAGAIPQPAASPGAAPLAENERPASEPEDDSTADDEPAGRTAPGFDPATSLAAVDETEPSTPDATAGAVPPVKKHRRLRTVLVVVLFALLIAVPTLWRQHGHPGGTPPNHGTGSEPVATPAPSKPPAEKPVQRPAPPPPINTSPAPSTANKPPAAPAPTRPTPPKPAAKPSAQPSQLPDKSDPATHRTATDAPTAIVPSAANHGADTASVKTAASAAPQSVPLASPLQPAPPAAATNSSIPPPATHIATLLDQARQALQDYRLTIPAGNNAAHYYRQVLQLEPDNTAATRGLKQVTSDYYMLIRRAIAAGDREHALQLLERARRVTPKNAKLDALQRQIEALPPAASTAQ